VERDGEPFYRIRDFHVMPPFFMSVVSGSNHWMFVSSTGGLTCGRRNPDNALFPYTTDDKIHDAWATTGPTTCLLVDDGNRIRLWKPFCREAAVYGLERNLYKNLEGNKLVFEEVNRDLGMTFSYSWSTGECLGFIRQARLTNHGDADLRVTLLDGLRNLLPYGVNRALQANMSTLVDAYKQAETVPGMPAAIFTLSSILTDRAEPSEALKATVAWSIGLDQPRVLLSEGQLPAFCQGLPVQAESFRKGQRGAFFVLDELELAAGSQRSWHIVADIEQGPAALPDLLETVGNGMSAATIEDDIDAGTRRLRKLVGSADGFQAGSDRLATGRHFSNTLFNIMRGGVFDQGYGLPVDDLLQFVEAWNAPLREDLARSLAAVEGTVMLDSALGLARGSGSLELERLVLEYLPLTFSRRHGDPSRPWNQFSIAVRNPDGSRCLNYEGNWRDIFQNWEALAISYPGYLTSFVAKFVNASTVDGYNPYRISREGFDWEVLDPDDPWSNIGYWGDHQVGYLQRLLDLSHRYHPGRLADLMVRPVFAYADVPYRLKGYQAQVAHPRNTVAYDHHRAEAIDLRVERIGADGQLVTLPDGEILHVNLLEKLLVPALAKIGNLVPGGGIWMNTQRPEWNDANNALVGYGLSMVTLCYLRRFLLSLGELLAGSEAQEYPVTVELGRYFQGLRGVLHEQRALLEGPVSEAQRKAFMDAAGALSEEWRSSIYSGFSGQLTAVGKDELLEFMDQVRAYLDHSIALNRREDGLYHAYNLLRFGSEGFGVESLDVMLEGQVAVLSSGYLDAEQSVALLERLRASELYRPDQNSYMLYPDRELPRFLAKNVIPAETVAGDDWIERELASGRTDYLERDCKGRVHFNGCFRNSEELRKALAADASVEETDAERLLEVFEEVFQHRRFTGRSGSMYKYEGLGCIYWHMVSKLALAVAEISQDAARDGADGATMARLAERYADIREGLGVHKSPADYGAFPTDAYSHTPGFVGVQQPGLTGQVKEDLLARFCELGVVVEAGEVSFIPVLLGQAEFLQEDTIWRYRLNGEECTETLQAGSLAFCLCGVPVIYRLAEAAGISVIDQGDDEHRLQGSGLGPRWSASLFGRDGAIRKIFVDVPGKALS
jgi:hypothetical protein